MACGQKALVRAERQHSCGGGTPGKRLWIAGRDKVNKD
jgi:hypothetical protein